MKTKNLLFICYVITGLTLIYTLSRFSDILSFYEEAQHELPKYFGWTLTKKILETIGFFLFYMTFHLISRNLRKGEVFTKKNEKVLSVNGMIILWIGLVVSFIASNTKIESVWTDLNTLVLVGFVLSFFAVCFKIAAKLQEEQELTI